MSPLSSKYFEAIQISLYKVFETEIRVVDNIYIRGENIRYKRSPRKGKIIIPSKQPQQDNHHGVLLSPAVEPPLLLCAPPPSSMEHCGDRV